MEQKFKFLKKINKRNITIFDLLLIFVIFLFLNRYYNKKMPMVSKLKKNGYEYELRINKYKYQKDDIMLMNFTIKNRAKHEKVIQITKEHLFNVIIYRDDTIIYKRDIMERNQDETKKIVLKKYSKATSGFEWFFNSNFQEEIKNGEYTLQIYSKDMDIKMEMKFYVE